MIARCANRSRKEGLPIEFYYDFSVVQDSTKALSPKKLQLRGEYPRDGRATETREIGKREKGRSNGSGEAGPLNTFIMRTLLIS